MLIPVSYTKTLSRLMQAASDAGKNIQNSQWTVGEHIEHSLVVNLSMLKGMCDAERKPVKPLSWRGRWLLFSGIIPRGRAKAPEAVKPRHGGAADALEKLHRLNLELLSKVSQLDSPNGFAHPYLGWLSPKQTLRFLEIHMRHHLKIVKNAKPAD